MNTHVPTRADVEIRECIHQKQSFAVIAGAGSGKTTSLVGALTELISVAGPRMRRDGQQAVCITYTNRAADVISDRLRQNSLFLVSTLHRFLWGEIRHYPKSIRESLRRSVIPAHIAKQKENDDGGKSKKAIAARDKVTEFNTAIEHLDAVLSFRYGDDTPYSNYSAGEIGHDDLIAITSDVILSKKQMRRILAQKYPYIFVDEAQDTAPEIVAALNSLCAEQGTVVAYFGDPMQQIYDKGMGEFVGPPGARVITKQENFRSTQEVVDLLNAFRKDVTQEPKGLNAHASGSVNITLVGAESPEEARGRYSEAQLERAQIRLSEAVSSWGWTEKKTAKRLFLARRMIARRAGFLSLHDLFDGPYASSRAKTAYEEGTHLLLKPLIEAIIPIIKAHRSGDSGGVMRLLTTQTIAFRPSGTYRNRSIQEVKKIANQVVSELVGLFTSGDLGEILNFVSERELLQLSERLASHLNRSPRSEVFDDAKHREEKGDWLADAFFRMRGEELERYYDFINENTPYSTQHGVKGEEYDDVIVVIDDIEAAWNAYSFAKMLTPTSAGEPKDTQKERSRKLAYVCFSRAMRNLRVLLFTPKPQEAAKELVTQGFFKETQISILK